MISLNTHAVMGFSSGVLKDLACVINYLPLSYFKWRHMARLSYLNPVTRNPIVWYILTWKHSHTRGNVYAASHICNISALKNVYSELYLKCTDA